MIGIVVALQSEASILEDIFVPEDSVRLFGKTVRRGKLFHSDIALTVCGAGKVNAASGACAVIGAGASLVYNFGTAGGLHSDTAVGEVYMIERAVQYDFDLTQINGGVIGTLNEEKENFLPLSVPETLSFPRRALGTGDRFNDSPADYALLRSLGADIRDMEGGAIAQACRQAGIPFVCLKAISDVYGAGSTTQQFLCNLDRAMHTLKLHTEEIIRGLTSWKK